MKSKIYYAHPISFYNTEKEKLLSNLLLSHGYEVVNPNTPESEEGYKDFGMDYFYGLVKNCNALAFQRFDDGMIGAGVAGEIKIAFEINIPVYDISYGLMSLTHNIPENSFLSIKDTRKRVRPLKKYRVYGLYTASKMLGEVEAETEEEAMLKAEELDTSYVTLCWSCSSEIDLNNDPYKIELEKVT